MFLHWKNLHTCMIRSENYLKMHGYEYFENESYIPQSFTRKFSPREPKCLKEVVVRDWDGENL